MNPFRSWWLVAFAAAASSSVGCTESPYLVLAQDGSDPDTGALLGLASTRGGHCLELSVDSGTIRSSTGQGDDDDDDDDESSKARSIKAHVPESGPVRFIVEPAEGTSSVIVHAVLHADTECDGDYVVAADDEVFKREAGSASTSNTGAGGAGGAEPGEGGASSGGEGGSSEGGASQGGAGQGGAGGEGGA